MSTSRTAALLAASVIVSTCTLTILAQRQPKRDAPVRRRVVMAELFTSEGCSSCPPADAALPQLVASARRSGIELVALEEHVDYWDRLGWKDPFSSAAFSDRQSDYHRYAFHSNEIYTPQLIVDGTSQCVGSDRGAAETAIARAAATPGLDVRFAAANVVSDVANATVTVGVPTDVKYEGPAEMLLAVTEDGLVSNVGSGENSGRRLVHAGVVRALVPAGEVNIGRNNVDVNASVRLAPTWRLDRLRLVAFLQDQRTRRILGAASIPLAQ